jgi:hypothetical protein
MQQEGTAWLARGQPLGHLFNVDVAQERAKVQMIHKKRSTMCHHQLPQKRLFLATSCMRNACTMHEDKGRKDVIEKVVTSLEVNRIQNARLHLTSIFFDIRVPLGT